MNDEKDNKSKVKQTQEINDDEINQLLKYDAHKSCYRLSSKKVLGFYYSEGYREKRFWERWVDFFLH